MITIDFTSLKYSVNIRKKGDLHTYVIRKENTTVRVFAECLYDSVLYVAVDNPHTEPIDFEIPDTRIIFV